MKYEEIIKVATLENEIEAKLLAAVLEEKGIPHIIGSYHDAAYRWDFPDSEGLGLYKRTRFLQKRNFRDHIRY